MTDRTNFIDEADKPRKKPRTRSGGSMKKVDLPKEEAPKKAANKTVIKDDDFLKTAIERVNRAYTRQRDNMTEQYDDLDFLAGNQWPQYAKAQREGESRPMLTINRLPQFVRQVTGDIRMMKASIKAIPVDSQAKEAVANLISCMIRYIENRSDAQSAYTIAADSQVACGVGHFRITTEYAEETTFNQEIRIQQIDDGVAVLWDPDSILPTREDAKWCVVPFDMTKSAYEEAYPDAPVADLTSWDKQFTDYWFDGDMVRVGEYWEKRPFKRELAIMSDGSITDMTGLNEQQRAQLKSQGAKFEKRDGHKIFRSIITLGHVLEEAKEWAGRLIPIIPMYGEEIRVGRNIIRLGVIRNAKEPQRVYNYSISAQTEVLALAPKSPWLGTDKNFEENEEDWATANTVNHPKLEYTPDPRNNGIPPSRNAPPVSSPGLSEAILRADNDMKAVTGIYDASLGSRSNETSGVAIKAREQQGDVGEQIYIDNFKRALAHAGRVMVDLIPHIYDTERQVQVVGEDGNISVVTINKSMVSPDISEEALDPIEETYGEPNPAEIEAEGESQNDQAPISKDSKPQGVIYNDVTVGAYGIIIETGPSYQTRRQEASDGMMQFIQSFPQAGPIMADMIASAQDWPGAKEISKRLQLLLPPPIQQLLAQEKQKYIGEIPPNGSQPQPQQPPQPPPNPVEMAKQQAEMADAMSKKAVAESNVRLAQIKEETAKIELASKKVGAASDMHKDIHGPHGADLNVLNELVAHVQGLEQLVSQVLQGQSGGGQPAQPQ